MSPRVFGGPFSPPPDCTVPHHVIESAAAALLALAAWIDAAAPVPSPGTRAALEAARRVRTQLLAALYMAERRAGGFMPETADELHAIAAIDDCIENHAARERLSADELHAAKRSVYGALPPHFAAWSTADAAVWAGAYLSTIYNNGMRSPRGATGASGPAATSYTQPELDSLERAREQEMHLRGERDPR